MSIAHRRDSFCGKMSACNNLRQYGIPYSLTTSAHRQSRVAKSSWRPAMVRRSLPGRKRLAESARRRIGARPAAVQHGALQREDSRVARHLDRDGRPLRDPRPHRPAEGRSTQRYKAKLAAIRKYVPTSGVPEPALIKMAKLGRRDRRLDEVHRRARSAPSSAGRRWRSIFGVVPCTVMSMMSNDLLPSACEVDICGAVGMHALRAGFADAQRAARLEQQLRR